MESKSYMFGTANKRSTLMESKGIMFPLEDSKSPRMRIVRKECPEEYSHYTECRQNNPTKLQLCRPLKEALFDCGVSGFKKANTDPQYTY